MNRRRFLGACIATIAAPAIVRAESLMPVRNRTWMGVDWGVSYGDRSGLLLLQQAQNAADRAMLAHMYRVAPGGWPTYMVEEFFALANPRRSLTQVASAEGSGSAGALAATQKHLEDMRRLVFEVPK